MKKKNIKIEYQSQKAVELVNTIIRSEDLNVKVSIYEVESMGSKYISITGSEEEVDVLEQLYYMVRGSIR